MRQDAEFAVPTKNQKTSVKPFSCQRTVTDAFSYFNCIIHYFLSSQTRTSFRVLLVLSLKNTIAQHLFFVKHFTTYNHLHPKGGPGVSRSGIHINRSDMTAAIIFCSTASLHQKE